MRTLPRRCALCRARDPSACRCLVLRRCQPRAPARASPPSLTDWALAALASSEFDLAFDGSDAAPLPAGQGAEETAAEQAATQTDAAAREPLPHADGRVAAEGAVPTMQSGHERGCLGHCRSARFRPPAPAGPRPWAHRPYRRRRVRLLQVSRLAWAAQRQGSGHSRSLARSMEVRG